MTGIRTALWEKWVEFAHSWKRITASSIVSPLLYLLTFGLGIGGRAGSDGHPYIEFLIPGVIALSSMNTGYSSVATSLNVQRLYEHSFDQIIISPTPLWQYILGQAIGGALRGLYAAVLVLLLSFLFCVNIHINAVFFLVIILNGMVFASLGVLAAILAKTHTDIAQFSTFVITPMTFLCNTFFSLEQMPLILKMFISFLPLSCTSSILRSIAYGEKFSFLGVAMLASYLLIFLSAAYIYTLKKKNM